MHNVLYPLTYLGLCPFLIVLARALQAQHAYRPTYLAVTPAEAEFASNNVSSGSLVTLLAEEASPCADVFESDAQYYSVYGFMKAKYGGTDAVWRRRVNLIYQQVEAVVLERKITCIVMWNGSDCLGKICQLVAARYQLKTVYIENGYFPNTLQIDPKGVNAESSLCDVTSSQWNVDAPRVLTEKKVEKTEKVTTTSTEKTAEAKKAGEMASQRPQVTETITREMPKINRNDTVTIKHVMSGKSETMKYKKAESMIASGEWVLVNE